MTIDLRSLRSADAIGSGQTDDTATIQAILDGFAQPFSTGRLDLPVGTYRITKPLVYRGDYGYGVRICGAHSAAQLSGTVLKWDGPVGGVVLELRGCTSTTVEHLAIDCAGKARAGIAITYDDANKKGTSGVYLDHLYISGGVGEFGAAVVAGYRPDGTRDDRQCDRIILSNSTFQGSAPSGTTQYGFLTGWANCKNFAVRDCGFTHFGTGIKFGGSGYMIVDGFAGGNNGIDFETATGNLEIRAGNSENSTGLLAGSTGANSGSVTITNFSWSGWTGADPILSYQGFLKLEGNYFRNTTPNGKQNAVPKIVLNATPGGPFSCLSNGNFYRLATGSPPITDTNGRPLAAGRLQSFGDYGGIEGDLEMLRLPTPAPGTVRATDLIVSGSLDFGDGRRWGPDGLFLDAESYWTPDGLYPGPDRGIKWKGYGTLIPGPDESFRFVGWEMDANGNRRSGYVVPPLKGNK